MLITELKEKETILPQISCKVFILNCYGCKEVYFPETQAQALQRELVDRGDVTGIATTCHLCSPEAMKLCLSKYLPQIGAADTVLVFACGIGVQMAADHLDSKKICAACDTYALPGIQGVTPLEYDCERCGVCYLNLTGGICPIAACAKGLINGQCGGAKNGMCEVDSGMACGWELIYRRLKQTGRLDVLKGAVHVRSYEEDDASILK